ncbi:MAG: VWA domain-containing protein [Flavobacteriales bacterium]|nr:VWA domain-containing protein [Flavobacteriales bacterium]
MSLKKTLIFLFAICLSVMAGAQNILPDNFDFGKVKMWNNPTASYTFTNNTSQRVAFLPITYQRNLYIDLPLQYIAPGQTVTIEAVFYTEAKGSFSVSQPLYLSGHSEPIYLKMSGRIQSFHPEAQMACPVMSQKNKVEALNGVTNIIVKDKESGNVLNNVDIMLAGSKKNYLIEHTKSNTTTISDIHIGLYFIEISKSGYLSLKTESYINKNTGTLIYELQKDPNAGVIEDEEIVESDSTTEVKEIGKADASEWEDIEKLRQIMNERFKGKKIIEQDVTVINEDSLQPPAKIEIVPETTKKDTSTSGDFASDGTLNKAKYASNNIVFLIDESSSMASHGKIDMLKTSMKNLVSILREQDLVTIVVYSRTAEIRMESTSGNQKDKINSVIDNLFPKGMSYGDEGLEMAYSIARKNFIEGGNNQVILASDGVFNSPYNNPKNLLKDAKSNSNKGIYTTTLGFGNSQSALNFMQQLSENGRGSFIKIETEQQAKSALTTEIMKNAIR